MTTQNLNKKIDEEVIPSDAELHEELTDLLQDEPDEVVEEIPEEEIVPEGEIVEPVEHEVQARNKGWVPKEEFKGDPLEWVDAKEFINRGPLYEALHKANRKIKNMEKTLDAQRQHYESVSKTAKEQAIKDLRKELHAAVENQDTEQATAIADRISEVAASPVEKPPVNEAYNNWVADNEWYEADTTLRMAATGIGFGLAQEHPDWSQDKILVEVTNMMKDSFPDKFVTKTTTVEKDEDTEEQATRVPSQVTTVRRVPANSKVKPNKDKLPTRDMLPSEARKNYSLLVKSKSNPHGVLSHEEYMRDYVAGGGTLLNAE